MQLLWAEGSRLLFKTRKWISRPGEGGDPWPSLQRPGQRVCLSCIPAEALRQHKHRQIASDSNTEAVKSSLELLPEYRSVIRDDRWHWIHLLISYIYNMQLHIRWLNSCWALQRWKYDVRSCDVTSKIRFRRWNGPELFVNGFIYMYVEKFVFQTS